MRTEKQKEVARSNGAKSRGPRTPQGKSKSSANSLRHGRYSQRNSLENDALISELHAAINQPPVPAAPPDQSPAAIEAYFAAIHVWSWAQLNQVRAFESRLVNSEIARQRLLRPDADSALLISLAFTRLCDETRILDLIVSTEDTLCRQWERAAERLSDFQALHHTEIARSYKKNAPERTRKQAAAAHSDTHSPARSSTHSAKNNESERTRQHTPHRTSSHRHRHRPLVQTNMSVTKVIEIRMFTASAPKATAGCRAP